MGLLALAIFFMKEQNRVFVKLTQKRDITIIGFSLDIFRRSRFVLSIDTYI